MNDDGAWPPLAGPIALTQGDPAGIGPEILARAFAQAPGLMAGCFVAGDADTMRRASALALGLCRAKAPDLGVASGVVCHRTSQATASALFRRAIGILRRRIGHDRNYRPSGPAAQDTLYQF